MKLLSKREVIDAYVRLARPIMVKAIGRQSCIASTRITIEVMDRFGIPAEPAPCKLIAQCEALMLAYVSGFNGEEKRAMSRKAKSFVTRRVNPRDPGWCGHVVAVVEGKLWLDASIDQIHSPELGFEIPHEVLLIPLDPKVPIPDTAIEAVVDVGEHRVKLNYIPSGDYSFVDTPAWEFDAGMELIVDCIVNAIVEDLAP